MLASPDALTVAVLVFAPVVLAVTSKETVSESSAKTVPTTHVTMPSLDPHSSSEPANVTPAGRSSSTSTPSTSVSPSLSTRSVYVKVPPVTAVAGALLSSARSTTAPSSETIVVAESLSCRISPVSRFTVTDALLTTSTGREGAHAEYELVGGRRATVSRQDT